MRHRLLFALPFAASILSLHPAALAQTLSGTVTDATAGKPASGVEVVLVDPMQGMAELGKTKTNAQGKFTLPGGQAQGPRLVRATRDGVNYFRMASPGTANVDLEVYDAVKKLDIEGTANIVRLQAEQSALQVVQFFSLKNASSPPRTLTGDNTFEIALPPGAELDGADAQGPNGQPITVSPRPLQEKNHYAFSYALKPGETRIEIGYHLPYKGEGTLAVPMLRPWNHFVVALAPGLQGTPKVAAAFRKMDDPKGQAMQIATNVKAGQDVSFRISGTGSFPQTEEQAQNNAAASSNPAVDNRPGGGLGPPIDAPDALAKYRWPILGILAVVLAGAAYISITRSHRPAPAAAGSAGWSQPAPVPESVIAAQTASTAATSGSNALLQAMKDELFQLEIERQQGLISPEDYEKQKAALDQTLKRALARSTRS